MNDRLIDSTKRFLDSYALDEDRMKSLADLIENHEPEPASASRFVAHWKYALAASILLLSTILGVLGYHQYRDQSMIMAIVQEVTHNHNNLKPLEIKHHQFPTVARYFDKLAFLPSETRLPVGLHETLIGGRYCSIQGHSAAQLRMRSADGSVSTLFQTSHDPETFSMLPDLQKGESPLVKIWNGYQVKLWIEHGIVMAHVATWPSSRP